MLQHHELNAFQEREFAYEIYINYYFSVILFR